MRGDQLIWSEHGVNITSRFVDAIPVYLLTSWTWWSLQGPFQLRKFWVRMWDKRVHASFWGTHKCVYLYDSRQGGSVCMYVSVCKGKIISFTRTHFNKGDVFCWYFGYQCIFGNGLLPWRMLDQLCKVLFCLILEGQEKPSLSAEGTHPGQKQIRFSLEMASVQTLLSGLEQSDS